MDPTTIELMEEHVRDIYRAITGTELPAEAESPPEVSLDELALRFIDLESTARQIPTVAERVPPFSFSPPLDVITDEHQVVLELAVPGVRREDVTVQFTGEFVTISGVRGGDRGSASRYLHAEIPRGPFHRMVRVPFSAASEASVEVEHGLIRICVPTVGAQTKSSDSKPEESPQ